MYHFDSEQTRFTFTLMLSVYLHLAGNFFDSKRNLFLQIIGRSAAQDAKNFST
jgi:hypothetical protein